MIEEENRAYKLFRNQSNKVFKVWLTKYRIYFLTDSNLEIWQIPDQSSPNQVAWESIAPLTAWMHLKTSPELTTIGSVQASMFLASFQLPQHPLLESINFNPLCHVLYGWSVACSAVYCFVVPWAKHFVGQNYLIPDLALHLRVGDHLTAPSFLLTSSHDLVFMIAGTRWSSWSLDFTEFVGQSGQSKDDSLCSCGRKRANVRNSTLLDGVKVEQQNGRNSSERGSDDPASNINAASQMFSANVQKLSVFVPHSQPQLADSKDSSQSFDSDALVFQKDKSSSSHRESGCASHAGYAATPAFNLPRASTASNHPHRPSFDHKPSFDSESFDSITPSHREGNAPHRGGAATRTSKQSPASTSFRRLPSFSGNTTRTSSQSNSNTKSPWSEVFSDPAIGA